LNVTDSTLSSIRLGLRENWQQFTLLIVVNGFVGAMVGLERAILPLVAESEFGLASRSVALSFLISFGVVKALSNMFAGRLGDRFGRKPVLVTGWLFALPVPFLIILAPTWGWVVFANVLLGINQGLCWSTTVIMKIDLVGPKQRGLAMGLNEFAGYVAVALTALATGYLAATYALRPVPFLPGIGFALVGLLLSILFVRETREYATLEASQVDNQAGAARPAEPEEGGEASDTGQAETTEAAPSFAQVFKVTSWGDRSLYSCSQAGLVNNLNDGLIWGLVPLYLAGSGLSVTRIAAVAAIYPGVWGMGQLLTGALSDHWGRKWLIAGGMWVQAAGIGLFVIGGEFLAWAGAAVLLGIGTAMVYPTLLAAVSDVAHPSWRGSAVGVYRLWRDLGFAVGGLTVGLLADAFGAQIAMAAIGGLTLMSGLVVASVMYETLPSRRRVPPLTLAADKGALK
jgi:MFS family permease